MTKTIHFHWENRFVLQWYGAVRKLYRKSFWTPVNSERFGVSDIFNKSSDCFQSSRIVNYNFMKNEGCSLISVWILARLPFAGAACWNFSPHHYSWQQRSPFRFLLLATNYQKLKIEKKVYRNRPIERASAIPHFIYLTVIKRILGMKWYDLRNLWNIFRDQFRLGDPKTPKLMTFYTGNRSMSCLPLPKASSALSSPDSNSSRS